MDCDAVHVEGLAMVGDANHVKSAWIPYTDADSRIRTGSAEHCERQESEYLCLKPYTHVGLAYLFPHSSSPRPRSSPQGRMNKAYEQKCKMLSDCAALRSIIIPQRTRLARHMVDL